MLKPICLILFLSIMVFGCTNHNRYRAISSTDYVAEEQPPVEQGEVWSDKEMREAKLVRDVFAGMLLRSTGNAPEMKRDAHPKHHGCVTAKLNIDNKNLPNKYRVGLFEKNYSLNSYVRFSNGDPNHLKADAESDVRGMAIKLLDVPYDNYLESVGVEKNNPVHDFVFMNSPNFFVKNPKDYGKFMKAVKNGGVSLILYGVKALLNPTSKFITVLRKATGMKVGNPLDVDYHSATPYKLGSNSMKMLFKSCKKDKQSVPKDADDNFLSDRLKKHLDKDSSCFDFYVQPNKKRKYNIENSQIKWSSKKAPFIRVGRLEVPKQSASSITDRNQFCEEMSFNPWRTPAENRPLGGVNRIRLEVYVKQAKMRQEYNSVEYPGPIKE